MRPSCEARCTSELHLAPQKRVQNRIDCVGRLVVECLPVASKQFVKHRCDAFILMIRVEKSPYMSLLIPLVLHLKSQFARATVLIFERTANAISKLLRGLYFAQEAAFAGCQYKYLTLLLVNGISWRTIFLADWRSDHVQQQHGYPAEHLWFCQQTFAQGPV